MSTVKLPLSSNLSRQSLPKLAQKPSANGFLADSPSDCIENPIQLTLNQQSQTSRKQSRYQDAHRTPPWKTDSSFVHGDFVSGICGNYIPDFIKENERGYGFDFVFLSQVLSPLTHSLLRRQSQPLHVSEILPKIVHRTTSRNPYNFKLVLLSPTSIHFVIKIDKIRCELSARSAPIGTEIQSNNLLPTQGLVSVMLVHLSMSLIHHFQGKQHVSKQIDERPGLNGCRLSLLFFFLNLVRSVSLGSCFGRGGDGLLLRKNSLLSQSVQQFVHILLWGCLLCN
mmetsp:Transcript_23401/g.45246  ORF Transcript_23401/g.45246 Transcript_23401/m.45246 type:complete len:282 (-) Transcript_23401:314-1159(-)